MSASALDSPLVTSDNSAPLLTGARDHGTLERGAATPLHRAAGAQAKVGGDAAQVAALTLELAKAKEELAKAKARITEMNLEMVAQAQAFRDESKRAQPSPRLKNPRCPTSRRR